VRIPVRATPRIRYTGGAYEAIGEEWTPEGLGAEKPGDKLSQRKGVVCQPQPNTSRSDLRSDLLA
jgi:hypothetical protein